MRRREEPVSTEIDPGRKYSVRDLDAIATQLLRDDSKTELCRDCGQGGAKTGATKSVAQEATDEAGTPLIVIFSEYVCPDAHVWYEGEGKKKGVRGENPVLFEEHEQSRRRREIYCAEGTPDPNIVSGLYHRTHPQGRKVNTPEQRRKHGASFYR